MYIVRYITLNFEKKFIHNFNLSPNWVNAPLNYQKKKKIDNILKGKKKRKEKNQKKRETKSTLINLKKKIITTP
jgi:hypothetical protein